MRFVIAAPLVALLGCTFDPVRQPTAFEESGTPSDDSTSGGGDATSAPAEESSGVTPTTVDPTTDDGGVEDSSSVDETGVAPECKGITEFCTEAAECCADQGLTCDMTTLGVICCGLDGTSCTTPNGEDCCGNRLCVGGVCMAPDAVPPFEAPFPCGESWTYSHHSQEVRRALDFIDNAGGTDASPALAALAGVATHHYEEGGAGNYIAIDHWGGWTTYYFHLQAFSVDDGEWVEQGDEIGLVGSTGASSGPHLHFEELHDGAGIDIWLGGVLLAPYPGSYYEASIVSANCP